MNSITMTDIVADQHLQLQQLTQRIGDLCHENNALTKQRDKLLALCRGFVSAESEWRRAFYTMEMKQAVDSMQDVTIAE